MPIYRLKRRRPFRRKRDLWQVPGVPYGVFTMEVKPIFEHSNLFDRVCKDLKEIFDHHPGISSNPTHGLSANPDRGVTGFIFLEFPNISVIAFLGNPVAVIKARDIVLPFLEDEYGPLVSPKETYTRLFALHEMQFLEGIPYPNDMQEYLVDDDSSYCTYFFNLNGLIS